MTLAAPYLLALCNAAHDSDFSFGVAVRLGMESSGFEVETTKLIDSIVKFSPATESVAIEFLQQFQNVPGVNQLGM